jgi:hypothetical protein
MKRNRLHAAIRAASQLATSAHVSHEQSRAQVFKNLSQHKASGRIVHVHGKAIELGEDVDLVFVKPGGIVYRVETKGGPGKTWVSQAFVDRLRAIGADPGAIEFAQRWVPDGDEKSGASAEDAAPA